MNVEGSGTLMEVIVTVPAVWENGSTNKTQCVDASPELSDGWTPGGPARVAVHGLGLSGDDRPMRQRRENRKAAPFVVEPIDFVL